MQRPPTPRQRDRRPARSHVSFTAGKRDVTVPRLIDTDPSRLHIVVSAIHLMGSELSKILRPELVEALEYNDRVRPRSASSNLSHL